MGIVSADNAICQEDVKLVGPYWVPGTRSEVCIIIIIIAIDHGTPWPGQDKKIRSQQPRPSTLV